MVHPELYPIDINTADIETLLKVPGIGPVSARRISTRQKTDPILTPAELKGIGVVFSKAGPYIEISGKRCSSVRHTSHQQWLFENMDPASWHSNEIPYQSDKIVSTGYSYPGQTGRRLNYAGWGQKQVLYCR